jgi:homoserine O-acetyltransferase/O-succinyltransferase
MSRALFLILCAIRLAAQPSPARVDGDWVARGFTFHTGEKADELRLHYTSLGKLSGNNAVLILHGTTGHGDRFLGYDFGGVLFGPGQPLDASRYYIILPDAIGHGQSSKPSDGLRAKFPRYNYDDMVRAQYRLVHDGLGVNHLRLVMGTSMGGMHTWMWGEMYPDFVDALMPLASAPVEIAGRNRILRRMIIDSIRSDPEWQNGNYTAPPRGIIAAHHALFMMTSSPAELYKLAPTRELADIEYEGLKQTALASDANDMLYAFDASRDYNPAPRLHEIKAHLYAINSADDEVNPPELGIMEREMQRVPRGRYILIPTSANTRGHGTHSRPAVWKDYLVQLLSKSETN